MSVPAAPLTLEIALVSAAVLGFRHGFDYDHIAAITDITGVQTSAGRAMRMGLMYVLGHAATVAVLGMMVIGFQLTLPAGVDAVMERVVGVTLLVLGVYVLGASVFGWGHGHHHGPRTRITVVIDLLLWVAWKIRARFVADPGPRYRLFADGLGGAPSFAVGIIHGLGAETPTQLLLFLLAANLGGVGKGVMGLGAFIVGMVAMNTLMCGAAAGLFRFSVKRQTMFRWVAGASAVYSIVVGAIFLAGVANVLPMLGK